MIELNFLAFCITVLALIAIAFGRDDIAKNSVAALAGLATNLSEIIGRLFSGKSDDDD